MDGGDSSHGAVILIVMDDEAWQLLIRLFCNEVASELCIVLQSSGIAKDL
jgi:hypothetical protein